MSFFGQITPAGLIAIRPWLGVGDPNVNGLPGRPGQEYTDIVTGANYVKATNDRFQKWYPVTVTGNPTTYYGNSSTPTPAGVLSAAGPAVWYGFSGQVYGKLSSDSGTANWIPLLSLADVS